MRRCCGYTGRREAGAEDRGAEIWRIHKAPIHPRNRQQFPVLSGRITERQRQLPLMMCSTFINPYSPTGYGAANPASASAHQLCQLIAAGPRSITDLLIKIVIGLCDLLPSRLNRSPGSHFLASPHPCRFSGILAVCPSAHPQAFFYRPDVGLHLPEIPGISRLDVFPHSLDLFKSCISCFFSLHRWLYAPPSGPRSSGGSYRCSFAMF